MSNKKNIIASPLTRPSTLQDIYEPGTSWAISFKFFDIEGVWSWPESKQMKLDIFEWINNLNRIFDLSELTNISSTNSFGSAHHWVSVSDFNPTALARIEILLKDPTYQEVFRDRMFSMRYCYKPQQSRRLVATIIEHVIYPIWWDPNHEIYGESYERNYSGLCGDFGCHHNPE